MIILSPILASVQLLALLLFVIFLLLRISLFLVPGPLNEVADTQLLLVIVLSAPQLPFPLST